MAGRKHPAWKYFILQDPKNTNDTTCVFCGKVVKGGIHRANGHLVGRDKNVSLCPKVPKDVQDELRAYVTQPRGIRRQNLDIPEMYQRQDDSEMQSVSGSKRTFSWSASGSGSGTSIPTQPLKQRGPMDYFCFGDPVLTVRERKKKLKEKQLSISEAYNKEGRDICVQYIARWFYRNGIPFHAARDEAFAVMLEAVGKFGGGLKPPSYHELRVPLLRKEVEYTKNLLKVHEEPIKKYGCTLMSDGWTDRKERTLINFLVNCPTGTIFVESIDASGYVKTGEKLFELLDGMITTIGEENVVQVISDNHSSYVLAGK
jgi:hypothetical protein